MNPNVTIKHRACRRNVRNIPESVCQQLSPENRMNYEMGMMTGRIPTTLFKPNHDVNLEQTALDLSVKKPIHIDSSRRAESVCIKTSDDEQIDNEDHADNENRNINSLMQPSLMTFKNSIQSPHEMSLFWNILLQYSFQNNYNNYLKQLKNFNKDMSSVNFDYDSLKGIN